jgi:hypothetical protein
MGRPRLFRTEVAFEDTTLVVRVYDRLTNEEVVVGVGYLPESLHDELPDLLTNAIMMRDHLIEQHLLGYPGNESDPYPTPTIDS